MKRFVSITFEDAAKLCARLEHDASWDKTDGAYYKLKRQVTDAVALSPDHFIPQLLRPARDAVFEDADECLETGSYKPLSHFTWLCGDVLRSEFYKRLVDNPTMFILEFLSQFPEALSQEEFFEERVSVISIVTEYCTSQLFLSQKIITDMVSAAFLAQFPQDYDILAAYKQLSYDILNDLESRGVALSDSQTYGQLRSRIESCVDLASELEFSERWFSARNANSANKDLYEKYSPRLHIMIDLYRLGEIKLLPFAEREDQGLNMK